MRTINVFDCGLFLGRDRSGKVAFKGGGSRGRIGSFSSASRLRLRTALLQLRLAGGTRVGVTLTLPWVVDDWSLVMDDFRDVMHRFRTYWLRRFPGCGAIYRIELQRRGAPHVHMISWHTPPLDMLPDAYFDLWLRSLGSLRGGSVSDFARHGVMVDLDVNMAGAIRYLCDHGSKQKQAQLGYRGKQWGIFGLANLHRWQGMPFELSDREFVLLVRMLRKLSRFRVKSDCVFGSRLSRLKRLNRVVYCSDSTVEKFLKKVSVTPLRDAENFDTILSAAESQVFVSCL